MTAEKIDRILGWILVLGLLCGVVAFAGYITGCATPNSAQNGTGDALPAVSIAYVRGQGAIGLDVYGQRVEAQWRETGITRDNGSMLHCSVVDSITVNGLHIGAGYLPPPISDPGCEDYFRPFRGGQSAATIERKPTDSAD